MKALRHLIAGIAVAGATSTLACDCFGPLTFCETLNPPYPNPEWWIPDAVVLGVKLSDYQHGMDVKIVQSFTGTLQPDDTIRVWGDCGALCRHYPGTWAVGDTVLWGFKITDLMGNSICGTSYEQPTDYMISICGVYYLDYANGLVSGPITSAVIESMPLGQFSQLVGDCLSTGVGQAAMQDELTVWYDDGVPVISLAILLVPARLLVINGQGQGLRSVSWNGGPMKLTGLPPGAYVVRVSSAGTIYVGRFVIQ